MLVTLFILGSIGGFLSGLLGLGGALVMIPLMLTVPPLVGAGELSMKTVAGLSMFQVLFSALSGIIIHKRNKYVHTKSLIFIGIPLGLAALAGAYFSKYLSDFVIMLLFFILIITALITLVFKSSQIGRAHV